MKNILLLALTFLIISCSKDEKCFLCETSNCSESKGSIFFDFDNIEDYQTDCVGLHINDSRDVISFGTAAPFTYEPWTETISLFFTSSNELSLLEEKCYEFKNFEEVNGDKLLSSIHVNYTVPHPNGKNFVPLTATNSKYIKICFDIVEINTQSTKLKGTFDADFWDNYKTGVYENVHKIRGGSFSIN